MKDFGTSESPKSTRSSTTHWCPGRPGHPAFRHNIAGDYPPSLRSPWRAAIESTRISAFFSVSYHAQQGIFILLGSKRLSREPHPPPIPQGQPPRVGLFRCLRLCIPAGFCGKLRTSRVSQPPSPTLDSSLIAPFLSVFERVSMKRSPEVRDIPYSGTPAPGPAHR